MRVSRLLLLTVTIGLLYNTSNSQTASLEFKASIPPGPSLCLGVDYPVFLNLTVHGYLVKNPLITASIQGPASEAIEIKEAFVYSGFDDINFDPTSPYVAEFSVSDPETEIYQSRTLSALIVLTTRSQGIVSVDLTAGAFEIDGTWIAAHDIALEYTIASGVLTIEDFAALADYNSDLAFRYAQICEEITQKRVNSDFLSTELLRRTIDIVSLGSEIFHYAPHGSRAIASMLIPSLLMENLAGLSLWDAMLYASLMHIRIFYAYDKYNFGIRDNLGVGGFVPYLYELSYRASEEKNAWLKPSFDGARVTQCLSQELTSLDMLDIYLNSLKWPPPNPQKAALGLSQWEYEQCDPDEENDCGEERLFYSLNEHVQSRIRAIEDQLLWYAGDDDRDGIINAFDKRPLAVSLSLEGQSGCYNAGETDRVNVFVTDNAGYPLDDCDMGILIKDPFNAIHLTGSAIGTGNGQFYLDICIPSQPQGYTIVATASPYNTNLYEASEGSIGFCVVEPPPGHDVALYGVAWEYPDIHSGEIQIELGGSFRSVYAIENLGDVEESNVEYRMEILDNSTGQVVKSSIRNYQGAISPNSRVLTSSIVLTTDGIQEGIYTLRARTNLANDNDRNNDLLEWTVIVGTPSPPPDHLPLGSYKIFSHHYLGPASSNVTDNVISPYSISVSYMANGIMGVTILKSGSTLDGGSLDVGSVYSFDNGELMLFPEGCLCFGNPERYIFELHIGTRTTELPQSDLFTAIYRSRQHQSPLETPDKYKASYDYYLPNGQENYDAYLHSFNPRLDANTLDSYIWRWSYLDRVTGGEPCGHYAQSLRMSYAFTSPPPNPDHYYVIVPEFRMPTGDYNLLIIQEADVGAAVNETKHVGYGHSVRMRILQHREILLEEVAFTASPQSGDDVTFQPDIRNNGDEPETDVPVLLLVSGPNNYRYTDSAGIASLPSDGVASVAFTWDTHGLAVGDYQINIRSILVDDAYPENNDTSFVLYLLPPPPVLTDGVTDSLNYYAGDPLHLTVQLLDDSGNPIPAVGHVKYYVAKHCTGSCAPEDLDTLYSGTATDEDLDGLYRASISTPLFKDTFNILVSASVSGFTEGSDTVLFIVDRIRPHVTVQPAHLAYSFYEGQATHIDDTLSVCNLGDDDFVWNITHQPTWASLSPSAGTTPSSANLILDVSAFSAGDSPLIDSIVFEAAGIMGSPAHVSIVLNILDTDTLAPAIDTVFICESGTIGDCLDTNALDICWSAADELGSLMGFSTEYNPLEDYIPDNSIDIPASDSCTTIVSDDGEWYFHIKAVDSALNWSSTYHLGPICVDATPKFIFDPPPNPLSHTVNPGDSGSYTVYLESFAGFSSAVALSLSNIDPTPVQGSFDWHFNPSTVVPPGQSILEVNTTGDVDTNRYTLTVLGENGSTSDTTHVVWVVREPSPISKIIHVNGSNNTGQEDGGEDHPFNTIQEGIDVSKPGDTVLVLPGLYVENLEFQHCKASVLASEFLLESDSMHIIETVIDGNALGSVLHLLYLDHDLRIIGLTIQNGNTEWHGGGLFISACSAPIGLENCRIQKNYSGKGGGAIIVAGSAVDLTNCLIRDNWAGDRGGGIHLHAEASSSIRGCRFENNIADGTAGGGGIFIGGPCSPTIDNCTFVGNKSAHNGGGVSSIGIGSSPVLRDCLFSRNLAESMGGGMYFQASGGSASLTRCRFEQDSASGGGGFVCYESRAVLNGCSFWRNSAYVGGGVLFNFNSATELYNCTFEGNTGSTLMSNSADTVILENCIVSFGVGPALVCSQADPFLNVRCCNVFGNSGGDWIGCLFGLLDVAGNFSDDPLFCHADGGDFTLQDNSPCLPKNNVCGILIGVLDVGSCFPDDVGETPYDDLPGDFSLSQNYPNPFNPSTIIEYSVPMRSHVQISIYNSLGQLVRTIVDDIRSAGSYSTRWDGADAAGKKVASGIYLYRYEVDGFVEAKKMILLK